MSLMDYFKMDSIDWNFDIYPSHDINSPFYMRHVKAHVKKWGDWPGYFITRLIKCNTCKKRFTPVNMWSYEKSYHVDLNHKSNKCLFCFSDWYILELAYNRVYSSTKLKRAQMPKELVEIEKLLIKTKILLDPNYNKKHNHIKIRINDHISYEQSGNEASPQRKSTRTFNRQKKAANC